ncbi:hypothetical protein C8A03DRAFT_32186 [Achaetomium macrosporum]|uniref:CFEM domain-containing protein n=1 Tax=Achaetomium macrosporum TaxID=79813 RepID=A0AAN7CF03_9PEZI|nr:hypothetical protein C8A03DRAFT_32186 [Achaetomium macrosporum]
MKTVIAFFSVAIVAVAQNLEGQPKCATDCIISAVSAAGCAANDMACQCGPSQAVIGMDAANCLLASCTGSQLLQAESAGAAQCSAYSASLTAVIDVVVVATGEAQPLGFAKRDDLAMSTPSAAASPTPVDPKSTAADPKTTAVSTAGAGGLAKPGMVGAGAVLGVLGVGVAL